MTLNLLIDTSVWLDLTKDSRHLPLLDALFAMTETGEVTLILPQIIIDEFARNRDRVMALSRASLSSHFKRVREAIVQFAPEEGRAATLAQLNEVDHRIATGGEQIHDCRIRTWLPFLMGSILDTRLTWARYSASSRTT